MKKARTALCFLLFIVACNRNGDDVLTEPSLGKEFYPVNTGRSWIYQVDSIAYDDNGPVQAIDTFTYQYKEEIGNRVLDGEGKDAYVVKRAYRAHDSDEWSDARIYTVQIADNKVQRVEENTRYVKLVFPLKDRNTWNGNMYNARGSQTYRVRDFKQPYLFNGNQLTSVKVEHINVENFIEEIVKYERYAEQVGMVHLLFDSLNTQSSGTRGFRYRLTLKSYNP